MRIFSSLVFAAIAAVALTACGINDPSSNKTEDFTGVLQPGGGNVHEFDSKDNGEYTVKLMSFTPDSNKGASIFLGQTVNGNCTRILGQEGTAFLQQVYALQGIINKGRYCVQLFDLLPLPQAQTYTLRVSHP